MPNEHPDSVRLSCKINLYLIRSDIEKSSSHWYFLRVTWLRNPVSLLVIQSPDSKRGKATIIIMMSFVVEVPYQYIIIDYYMELG